MCRINDLPEGKIFKITEIQESIFGFSVTIKQKNLEEESDSTGDKVFLRKTVKNLNVKNGCLGLFYDDYSDLEKIKIHLLCLFFAPKKYFRKLMQRKKFQRLKQTLNLV